MSAEALVSNGQSGWSWAAPTPQGNSLSDVEFTGRHGYAVGAFGTLLRSDNGGTTWTGLPVRAGVDAVGGLEVLSPRSIVIPGAACTLRRSDDGGIGFRDLRLLAPRVRCPERIADFDFPTPLVGYVALRDGAVYRTADGGRSFERRTPLPRTPATGSGGYVPLALRFTSPDVGFAIAYGRDGAIHRTADGGRSWTQTGGANGAGTIDFPDAQNGYAAGSDSSFRRTTDGGRTWVAVPVTGVPVGQITGLSCGSPTECVFVLSGMLFRTSDGGATAQLASAGHGSAVAVDHLSGTEVVSVGYGGVTLRSTDAGRSFRRIGQGLAWNYDALTVSSRSLAVAYGDLKTLARTTDGGRSWSEIGVPSGVRVIDATFPTARTGFLLDRSGDIIRTRDGGGEWQDAARFGAKGLLALSEEVVLAGASDGIRRSTDGGDSFRRVSARRLGGRRFYGFDRAGSGSVIFGYGSFALARSLDRGRTWRRVHRPTRRALWDIDFVNRRVGYAVAQQKPNTNNGQVLKTSNGGRTWHKLLSVGTTSVYGVAFASARSGWLHVEEDSDGEETAAGRLLRTADGGRTWRPQRISAVITSDVAAFSATRGAVISAGLFTTTTGGDAPRASSITLRPSRRQLRRRGVVLLRGRVAPRLSAQPVAIAAYARGSWTRTLVETAADGSFELLAKVKRTTRFVAQWDGDGVLRGAGTRAVRVVVRR